LTKEGISKLVSVVIIFALVIAAAASVYFTYGAAGSGNFAGVEVNAGMKVQMVVRAQDMNATSPNYAWLVTMAAKGQWWSPSCMFACHGINYTLDPTPVITTPGKDLVACKLVGTSGMTCSSPAGPVWMFVSTNVNTVFVAGDVFTSTTIDGASTSTNACAYANAITQTTTSLSGESLTAGASGNYISASATTATATISWVGTFSQAAGATSTLDAACLVNGYTGASILWLEGAYGPVTMPGAGNSVAVTIVVTIT
jgi:hypothetical protein